MRCQPMHAKYRGIETTYGDCETSSHAVEVVRMLAHRHDFGNNGIARPLDPKDFCQLFKICVEASRMEKTVSPSQLMHKLLSFSSKKLTPSWLARRGTYSIIARRTRHCLSSASCTMAGNKD